MHKGLKTKKPFALLEDCLSARAMYEGDWSWAERCAETKANNY